MVAIGANRVGSFSSLASSHEKKRVRRLSFGTIAYELTMPAMLNVFDGAPKVIKEQADKAIAEDAKAKLEAEGAKVTLK